jgi:hypothetical protein
MINIIIIIIIIITFILFNVDFKRSKSPSPRCASVLMPTVGMEGPLLLTIF